MIVKIEELRSQLHAMIQEKSMTDSDVLALSQELDIALNRYWELVNRRSLVQNLAYIRDHAAAV